MRTKAKAVCVGVLVAFVLACGAASGSRVPGATALKVCAAAGPYWPTMTLAVDRGSAWIACKEQSRVIRVNTKTGKRTKSVRLRAPAIAVRSGYSSIWALDTSGTLYRLNPRTARVTVRISLPVAAAYNIWIGGDSVWVADDQGAKVVRVSPSTNRAVAEVPAGDGPASMAFGLGSAWVVNHRDTTVQRIDLQTNVSTLLTTLGGEGAPERMVWSNDRLWITGRGTDLLELDPADGKVDQTIEIGGSGIDLVANRDDVWVATRSVEVDPSGFPTMESLKRVRASTGAVTTVAQPTNRVDVHGLTFANEAVWIADNRRGYVYRVPAV